jgi:hypothetical protein
VYRLDVLMVLSKRKTLRFTDSHLKFMGKLVESHGEIALIENQNLVSEWGL